MQTVRRRPSSAPHANAGHSVVGDIAKYMITRSVLKRFARIGGLQGMLLSAAATYALDRYLSRRR